MEKKEKVMQAGQGKQDLSGDTNVSSGVRPIDTPTDPFDTGRIPIVPPAAQPLEESDSQVQQPQGFLDKWIKRLFGV